MLPVIGIDWLLLSDVQLTSNDSNNDEEKHDIS